MSQEQVQYTLSLKDLLTGKVKDADTAVNRFESSLSRAQSRANELAAAVGVAFGVTAVVAFGQKMVQAGTQVENALTGLTTLLRDKAEAQQVINNTMEDATRTPFAFEGLLMANKALISAGVGAQQARTDVLNLANAIAATGGGDDELQRMVINMQQIKNTGQATAADIKQFAFAGVNIYKILADATGQPIEKTKDMTVSYELLTMALQKAHDEGGIYYNGLENMANNTSVRISNLGDAVFQLAVQMFNDLKPAIDGVIGALGWLVDKATAAWQWMVKNKDIIQALATGLAVGTAAWLAYNVVVNAGWIAATIAGGAYTALAVAIEWVNAAFIASPIGWIVGGLAAVTASVVYCYNHFAKFRAVLWGVWETVKEFGRIVTDVFVGLWQVIKGVFTMDADMIELGSQRQVDAIFNAGQRLGSAFKKGYEGGMNDFKKDQEAEATPATINAPKPPQSAKTKLPTSVAAAPKSQTKGAVGSKAVSINIQIGSLIKDFKISTTNMQESAGKVREMVTQAILAAVNDSQIVAGS